MADEEDRKSAQPVEETISSLAAPEDAEAGNENEDEPKSPSRTRSNTLCNEVWAEPILHQCLCENPHSSYSGQVHLGGLYIAALTFQFAISLAVCADRGPARKMRHMWAPATGPSSI